MYLFPRIFIDSRYPVLLPIHALTPITIFDESVCKPKTYIYSVCYCLKTVAVQHDVTISVRMLDEICPVFSHIFCGILPRPLS